MGNNHLKLGVESAGSRSLCLKTREVSLLAIKDERVLVVLERESRATGLGGQGFILTIGGKSQIVIGVTGRPSALPSDRGLARLEAGQVFQERLVVTAGDEGRLRVGLCPQSADGPHLRGGKVWPRLTEHGQAPICLEIPPGQEF